MFHIVLRFGFKALILLMCGGLFFGATIETTMNGGLEIAIKVLALPLGIGIFSFTYFYREALADHFRGPRMAWFMALMLFPISLFLGWTYIKAVNMLTTEQNSVIYSGPVLEKYEYVTSTRLRQYKVRIQNTQTGESVEMEAAPEIHAGLQIGQVYCRAFNRGLFGIPFRWRLGANFALEAACNKETSGANMPN